MTTSLAALRGISGAAKWVSGRTYGVDAIVWSPANKQLYVRTGAAAVSSTDPSADTANWAAWAASGVKSVQRGLLTIGSVDGSGTDFDLAITAVNMSKTVVNVLGRTVATGYTAQQTDAYIRLHSSTTVRATRLAAGGTGGTAATYSVEVIEHL